MTLSYRVLSERLELRPFAPEDITATYLYWLNDRQLMRYSRQRHVEHTRESCERYLAAFAGTPDLFWNVSLRQVVEQVGTVTAYVDPISAVADVGLLIGVPDEGYGRETLGALLAYLFDVRGLRKVTVGTRADNRAMARIAERAGMRLEGTLREHEALPVGDVLLFGILRRAWTATRESERTRVVVRADP